jgi:translocation protein SEC62
VIGVIRVVVFAAVWITVGRQFWVLPNITSDEIPIDEVFSPMWAFDDLDANGNVVGRYVVHFPNPSTPVLSLSW